MRYSGKIGFATKAQTSPGVWEDVITERDYIGDLIQRTERLDQGDSIIPSYRTTTSVSVLSDGVLKERYSDVRYVTVRGVKWTVQSIIHKFPRIEMYLTEGYNGPTP
jgi:hypothetical protein